MRTRASEEPGLGWLRRLAAELGVGLPETPRRDEPECVLWARCGAMAVTGRSDGAPLFAPGSPARSAQRALDVVAACAGREVGSVGILGERAATMGLTRRAPWSAGGGCRLLPARDGWFAISLARPSDHELVPALVEDASAADDPWGFVARWLRGTPTAEAEARTALLGLAAAAVPASAALPARAPVVAAFGGARTVASERPLVVDLSSLWAGPLCAQLLHRAGARVITVESRSRPDGARRGSMSFYEHLHRGHEPVVLDFATELDVLRLLLREADVVVEASRPRALGRLGLDARDFVEGGTIWVSITAYGRQGDAALRVGFGDDVAAGAGLVVFDGDVPCFAGDALADPLTGVSAAAAAMLALQGPRGVLLDVSMHQVARDAAVADPGAGGAVLEGPDGWEVVCGSRRLAVAGQREKKQTSG